MKAGRDGKLSFGVCKCKSPCPPGGAHICEWTATAKSGNGTLATAKAHRKYPE